MKNLYKYLIVATATLSVSNIAYAESLGDILNSATGTISDRILVILVAIGLVLFIVGIIRMMQKADSPEEIRKWRNVLLWGIIALFLMFSVIGVLSVLTRSTTGGNPVLPQLPESQKEKDVPN